MRPHVMGIRAFSQRISYYLQSTRPVILTKRGKPYRLLQPITAQTLQQLDREGAAPAILRHQAIGLWKRRWPRRASSAALVRQTRRREDQRRRA